MQCYTCLGMGYITCPTCQGKGGYFKVVGNKNMFEACYQCGGRRSATCPTCHGTREVPYPNPAPAFAPTVPVNPPVQPKPTPPDPALLGLEGRWKNLFLRYDLAKQNDGYHVTVLNLLGMKLGEGKAMASGKVLTLTLGSILTGYMTADLQLSGDQLKGTTRGIIPMPFILKRA